jgi:hypothetical protein
MKTKRVASDKKNKQIQRWTADEKNNYIETKKEEKSVEVVQAK